MEQINYPEPDKNRFSEYIADPSVIASGDSEALEKLIDKFPYCQLLYSFYARSVSDTDPSAFERQLSRAALFSPDRVVLYNIINDAEKLKSPGTDTLSSESISTESITESPDEVSDFEQADDSLDTNPPETIALPEDVSPEAEQKEFEEAKSDPELLFDLEQSEPQSNMAFEVQEPEFEDVPMNAPENNSGDLETEIEEEETAHSQEDEVPKLTEEYSINSDNQTAENTSAAPADIEISENKEAPVLAASAEADDKKVSKYDDDKLPYSFLWWLSKTRKEHSENYQPYVNFTLDTSQTIRRNSVDQLSSQIIENIFHLQSPVEELANAPRTIPFQVKRKEDYILEKFIKDEPQIKAPNSQKLDTENKARKSAEDPNDLVSETLAQIYTDQMLFHKAIDTYKKLSLKFPEKSTYFADQIRELENKIN